MVLLCNDNPSNIKKNSMLQCLNKKKQNFNIFVIPLKEEEKLISNNIDLNIDLTSQNISDEEIKKLFSHLK
jgi:hypothetical protein